jgi:NAD(P)H-dependent FMN reductase
MTRIAVILGSTRPGRKGKAVADWVVERASHRTDAEFVLVDLVDHPLPHLDEPVQPSMGSYENEHTKRWSATIEPFDGYVFVTPEYNHAVPGVLKNAIDYLYREWNNKAAGFVGYGTVGGARAVEQLRLIASGVELATVRAQVALSLFTDFEDRLRFTPSEANDRSLDATLDAVVAWSSALASLRS